MGEMGSLFTRSLVLVCSLFLALPQGWCCMAASAGSATSASPTKQAVCSHCAVAAKKDSSEKQPVVPAKSCPCAERVTLLAAPAVHAADVSIFLVAILPVTQLPRAPEPVYEQVASTTYPPPCRLHVFECVWLC